MRQESSREQWIQNNEQQESKVQRLNRKLQKSEKAPIQWKAVEIGTKRQNGRSGRSQVPNEMIDTIFSAKRRNHSRPAQVRQVTSVSSSGSQGCALKRCLHAQLPPEGRHSSKSYEFERFSTIRDERKRGAGEKTTREPKESPTCNAMANTDTEEPNRRQPKTTLMRLKGEMQLKARARPREPRLGKHEQKASRTPRTR